MLTGIDLGGTKIEAIVLSTDGAELARERRPTPAGDYAGTLRAIKDLVDHLESRVGRIERIGIGAPGSPSPIDGRMRNANSTCLNGEYLCRDLEQLLGRAVRIANDADCFALSEASDGAARGASTVLGVIIGTGTGGGIVVDGRLLLGPNAIAGEWGHNPLPWPRPDETPGPACYCGKQGCIETFLSGPGLSRDHREHHGTDLEAAEIARRAAAADIHCAATLDRYEHRMARALASVINLLDPDVVVLGGGLSNIGRLYENVPRLLPDFVFSDTVRTRLLPPAHGDSSGVRGAARLWS